MIFITEKSVRKSGNSGVLSIKSERPCFFEIIF